MKFFCEISLLYLIVYFQGPGSLPGYRRRPGTGGMHGDFDDGASDISSTSGFSAFGYRSGKYVIAVSHNRMK